MGTIELLKHAITNKLTIEYEYEYGTTDVTEGVRIGNPHILYDNGDSVLFYKLDGVCSTKGNLPDWRRYKTKFIKNVKFTDSHFEIAPGFNLENEKGKPLFKDIVCKVQ